MSPPPASGAPARGALSTYRAKRDFARTPEPAGDEDGHDGARRFVVQRHRARRLHYDVRLELDGVLVSWAVPKGPTLDPAVRRLAVHVEDHPIEYIDFEGVIPAGNYGAGDVIVWDRGTWSPAERTDPARDLAEGELHVDLRGEKLAGRFVFVRTDRDRAGDGAGDGRAQWLLLHKADDHAVAGWDAEDHPDSVLSGRTNDEVAADPDHLWRSDAPADRARVPVERPPGPRRPEETELDTELTGPTADELAALDDLDDGGDWEVAGRTVRLTNLDKVLFPGRGGGRPLTKRDLVRYHAYIGPVMVPYLRGRPVNLHRYPDGVERPGFWHKEAPDHAPGWVARWRNEDADPGETQWYVVVDSVATLVWLANYGAVELHPWTSRIEHAHRPTWALVDIDPGTATSWDDVVVLAKLHRTALEHLGVEGRPKVTGQRGIQVWIPVSARYGFDETRAWVERLSRHVGRTVPEMVSWKWQKADRGGLARLDYTQNAVNRTLVAPYGARPAPGAPVSVPLEWDELDDPELRPDRWTIETVLDRVGAVGDPFAPLLDIAQALPSI